MTQPHEKAERNARILRLLAEGWSYRGAAALVWCSASIIAGVVWRSRCKDGLRARGYRATRKALYRPPPIDLPPWQTRFVRPMDRRAGR